MISGEIWFRPLACRPLAEFRSRPINDHGRHPAGSAKRARSAFAFFNPNGAIPGHAPVGIGHLLFCEIAFGPSLRSSMILNRFNSAGMRNLPRKRGPDWIRKMNRSGSVRVRPMSCNANSESGRRIEERRDWGCGSGFVDQEIMN